MKQDQQNLSGQKVLWIWDGQALQSGTIKCQKHRGSVVGILWDTYPKAMQDELLKNYNQRYSKEDQKESSAPATNYKVPDGYDEHVEHFTHFFEGVRTGKAVVEDPVFGFRACAPCLAANESYFQKKIIYWDPVNMKLK